MTSTVHELWCPGERENLQSRVPVSAPTLPAAVNPPPDLTLPSPPAGFVEPNMAAFRGCYPSKSELAAAPAAISDLARFATCSATLGTAAPSPTLAISLLTSALGWRSMRTSTDAWDKYVRAQDALAWQSAMICMDELKPLFLIALAKDSSLGALYPGLTAMFTASRVSARQAATTKRKNRAAATAAGASGTTTATSMSAETATGQAAPGATVFVQAAK
jgi:hypothetical protein